MKDFQNLAVWQKAHALTLKIYQLSTAFPKEEMFGITSQIRRSSASIGANIAEGCGKSTDAEFARFLQIAFGSACETEYHLILARDLDHINSIAYPQVNGDLIEVKRMLASLISKVKGTKRVLSAER